MKKYLILLITTLFVVNQTSCFDDNLQKLEEAGVLSILNPKEGFTSSYPGAGAGAPASTTATEFDGNLGDGDSDIHINQDIQAIAAALIAVNKSHKGPQLVRSSRKTSRSTSRTTRTRKESRKSITGHFANVGIKRPKSHIEEDSITANAGGGSSRSGAGTGFGVGASATQIATNVRLRSAKKRRTASTANKKFICNNCGKSLASKSNLKKHMQNIHEKRKYCCTHSDCKKEFTDISNLNKHINSEHKGIRYYCPHPDCNKSFTQKDSLNEHINSTHIGIKITCPRADCEMKFANSKQLKQAH